ncbi:MAG: hypothetical protein GY866_22080 [Proteobacteria bacterium]|nr:hypothetical protein [Pseudomonadota bacterium]
MDKDKGSKTEVQQELDTEALVSATKATFNVILTTPKDNLVTILNTLIKRGELIIWNPKTAELVSEGDIVNASINGRTVKISVAPKEELNLTEWFNS